MVFLLNILFLFIFSQYLKQNFSNSSKIENFQNFIFRQTYSMMSQPWLIGVRMDRVITKTCDRAFKILAGALVFS